MKRYITIFFSLIFLIAVKLHSQNLQNQIDLILEDSLFINSQIAIDVYDLQNQEYIYRKNENLVLRPASNLKLLTTSAALLYLGVDAEFTTNFIATGPIIDSTLKGDLIVTGGFDPLFSESDLDSVVQQIKNLGIKEIKGKILPDVSNIDSLYFGNGWMWDDNPDSYMPYLSSLNINKNAVKIYFTPGNIDETVKVNLKPSSNYYTVNNNLLTTRDDTSNFVIYRDWLNNTNDIILEGNISYNHPFDSAEVNIINPELFFVNLLAEKLAQNDVYISQTSELNHLRTTNDTIVRVRRNLLEIITETNKESDNLSAEMIVRKLSAKYFPGSASAKKGIRLIDSLIINLGHNPKTFKVVDGSGLSHYNLISASLLVDLLKYMHDEKPILFKHLYNSLPIAGFDGTLEKRMKSGPAFLNVHAKTGTISGVSCLSGFVNKRNGNMLAFSTMIQSYSGSATKARKLLDKIANILADLE